jgi:hypothetical protein
MRPCRAGALSNPEVIMRQQLRAGTIVLALLASVSLASAQRGPGTDRPDLTPQQQQTVNQGLASQPNDSAPAGYQSQVGSKMPDSMTAHPMPGKVASDVPETKNLLFIKLPDRVLLIDPDTQIIAEIVPVTETTGSVPGEKK